MFIELMHCLVNFYYYITFTTTLLRDQRVKLQKVYFILAIMYIYTLKFHFFPFSERGKGWAKYLRQLFDNITSYFIF